MAYFLWSRSLLLLLLLLLLVILHPECNAARNVKNQRVCNSDFTDLQSRWVQSRTVILGTTSGKHPADGDGLYNVTVKVRKSLTKQGYKLNLRIPITVGPFRDGKRDKKKCLMNIRQGRKYIFFLEASDDPLHYKVKYFPVASSRTKLRKIRRIRCSGCVKAPKITQFTKSIERNQDDGNLVLTFRCKASGRPPARFHWLKDGRKLTKQEVQARKGLSIRYTRRNTRLRIRKVTESDAGTYTCVARNVKGSVQDSRSVSAAKLASKKKEKIPLEEDMFIRCKRLKGEEPYCLNGGRCFQQRWGKNREKICICPPIFNGQYCEYRIFDPETGRNRIKPTFTSLLTGATPIFLVLSFCLGMLIVVIVLCTYCACERRRLDLQNWKDAHREKQRNKTVQVNLAPARRNAPPSTQMSCPAGVPPAPPPPPPPASYSEPVLVSQLFETSWTPFQTNAGSHGTTTLAAVHTRPYPNGTDVPEPAVAFQNHVDVRLSCGAEVALWNQLETLKESSILDTETPVPPPPPPPLPETPPPKPERPGRNYVLPERVQSVPAPASSQEVHPLLNHQSTRRQAPQPPGHQKTSSGQNYERGRHPTAGKINSTSTTSGRPGSSQHLKKQQDSVQS